MALPAELQEHKGVAAAVLVGAVLFFAAVFVLTGPDDGAANADGDGFTEYEEIRSDCQYEREMLCQANAEASKDDYPEKCRGTLDGKPILDNYGCS